MSLSLNVPTCQMAIGVPHRATVKMKPTKSAFKLYPKSVYASLHLCLYLVQPQDLPGPSQPPPLPVRPPTAATKGRLEHLSQMVSPSSAHSPPGLEPQWGKSPSLTRGPQGPPFLPLSPELTCSSHKGPLADPPMNEDWSCPRAFAWTVPSAQTILPPRSHSVPSLTPIGAFSNCHLLGEAVPTIPLKCQPSPLHSPTPFSPCFLLSPSSVTIILFCFLCLPIRP